MLGRFQGAHTAPSFEDTDMLVRSSQDGFPVDQLSLQGLEGLLGDGSAHLVPYPSVPPSSQNRESP